MPPLNDNIANAQAISGASGSTTGDNTAATLETGEADALTYNTGQTFGVGGGRSVYFKWTAPSFDRVEFSTDTDGGGSPLGDSILSVLDGSNFATANLVAQDDDSGPGSYSRVRFTPVSGHIYYIAVDGYNGTAPDDGGYDINDTAEGSFALNWQNAPPANDNLTDALALSDATPCEQTIVGSTLGATSQTSENDPAPGFPATHSVWYTLAIPFGIRCRLWLTSTDPDMADGIMSVYSGAMTFGDTPIVQGDDELGSQPECIIDTGDTFVSIQIDTRDAGGAFTLHWQMLQETTPPANDLFADAEAITGSSGSTNGDTTGASYECGEDSETFGTNDLSRTVWYERVAVASSLMEITLTGDDSFPLLVDVFEGTTLGSLTPVTDALFGTAPVSLLFSEVSGVTYYVRVNGHGSGVEHAFTLDWLECTTSPPAEDDFANAGLVGTFGLTNVVQQVECTTLEAGEPNPDGYLGTAWQKLVLGSSAKVVYHRNSGPAASGSGIHVWKGNILAGLTEVGAAGTVLSSSDTTMYLSSGTYYFQFGMKEISPADWDVNITVTLSTETTSGDVTVSAVGDYTAISLGSTRLDRGQWIRMLITRNSGDFVHRGACSPALDPANTETVKLAVLMDDSDAEIGYVGLHGHESGMNEIVHTLDSDGYVLVDGVQAGTAADVFMGSLPRSQDVLLLEIHLTSSSAKTLRVGMPEGPSCLDDGGWSFTFSEIAVTDDPAIGPHGSPDGSSKDVGYFAGWTDSECHLPTTSGTAPTVTSSPPAALAADFALDLAPSGATKSVDVPLAGLQPQATIAFPLVVGTALDTEMELVAFLNAGGTEIGGISLGDDGILYAGMASGSSGPVAAVGDGSRYDIEATIDCTNPDDEKITARVNGTPVTYGGRRTIGTPQSYPARARLGLIGSGTGEIFIGPVSAGRTRKSVPLGTVTVEALPIDGIGTHLLPTVSGTAVHSFSPDEEVIIGDALTLTTWSGNHTDAEGGGVLAGENVGGNLTGDLTVSGNPTSSATVTVHSAASEGWLRMMTGFLWPQASGSVYFDFYVTGPSGKTVRVDSIGKAGAVYSAPSVGVTCTGSRQHVFGWSDVNFLTSWVDASDHATFNLHFDGGGGAQTYTVDTFQAWTTATIQPTYALSSAGGASASEITSGDATSDGALTDTDDDTVVMLDRKGTFTLVSTLGDIRATPIVTSFFQEVTQYAQRSYLEYTIQDPSIPPGALKLLTRTGGWRHYNTTRVTGRARFGIEVDGSEKSIGGLVNSTIAGGELLIPEPSDPSARWDTSKVSAARLRMGYYDGQYEEAAGIDGYHAYGNGPDETYDEPEAGGLVAFAQLEALKLERQVAASQGQIIRYR